MEKLIKKWQKILGLTEWSISYEICDHWADDADFPAKISHTPEKREVVIQFLAGHEAEWLLVHELAHLVYDIDGLSEGFFCDKCQNLQRRIEDGAVIHFAEILIRNFGEGGK